MKTAHFAFFLRRLDRGGAEGVLLDLARGLVARGDRIDFLLGKRGGALEGRIPEGVQIVEIGEPGLLEALPSLLRLPIRDWRDVAAAFVPGNPRLLRSAGRLAAYLDHAQPDALLTTLRAGNITSIWAGSLARSACRVIVREANNMSAEQDGESKPFKRAYPRFVRNWFGRASHVIAVSEGVSDDLVSAAGISRDHIATVPNPVDANRVRALAKRPLPEIWPAPEAGPVIMTAGRLVKQKNHALLVRAFAHVRKSVPARLVIFGEGDQRAVLEAQIDELGLADAIQLPGSIDNVYPSMTAAAVFVLSSDWEGFPNVLVEALACGTRIVSTDCPSGPREILRDGDFGTLVERGDDVGLARAILAALAAPADPARQHARANDFSLERAVESYRNVLLGTTVS